MTLIESKYLVFRECETNGKTRMFEVRNKSGALLGTILFYYKWRKHVFSTSGDFIFDSLCLGEIRNIIAKLDLEMKLEKQNKAIKQI